VKELKSVCAMCGVLLVAIEVTRQDETAWRWHHLSATDTDHEPVPAPTEVEPVCDFCGSRNPRWRFETRKMFEILTVLEEETVTQRDSGTWLACGLCKRLVEQRNLTGLVRRGTANQRRFFPDADAEVAAAMQEGIRDAYTGFFAAGPGKPKRVKKEKR
jgi:hypothetical protein